MAVIKQQWRTSCAAACLQCAASELGVLTIPKREGLTLWDADEPLLLDKFVQKRLFQWTSHNFQAIAKSVDGWGYSMPTDVADCAAHLGLEVEIVVCSSWTATGLKFGFQDEWSRIKRHSGYRPATTTRSDRPLGHDERELRVLAEWQDLVGPVKTIGSLHYVMVRPNGSVMEPGHGLDVVDILAAKTQCNMHGTGLSIIVRKRASR
jgi:cysteine protease IpaJ